MRAEKNLHMMTAIFAILVLALLPKTYAQATTFTDVNTTHHAVDAIEWGASVGIIGGYADGTFKPNAMLSEGQFVAILTRYYPTIRLEAKKYEALNDKVWSNSSYEALARFEVPVLGYADQDYRNKPVPRGVIAQVLSMINGQSVQLEEAIQYLFDEEITVGQNQQATNLLEKFGAKNNLSRAQAVIFFYRLNTQGKVELAQDLITNQLLAPVGSAEAEAAKKRATDLVDSRVIPIHKLVEVIGVGGYIEGQKLPEKPTFVKGQLIANKKYPLPKNFAPGESKAARADFNKMIVVARRSGIQLTAISTYRSFDYQTTLYNRYVKRDGKNVADRYSARPGYSEHQTGLAFDIGQVNQEKHWASDSFGDTKAGKWVAENAHLYGFVMRYPKGKDHITGYQHEPWHFRYVGQKIATQIYKDKLTLEEYLGI